MGFIYQISSTQIEEIYIGQTKKTIERRWYQHCYKAMKYILAETQEDIDKLNGKHQKLYLAMSEHGIESFTIVVLEEVDDEDLGRVEAEYIDGLDLVEKGLNMKPGGDIHNEEVRKLISERTKAAFNKIEIVEKMRKYDVLRGLPPKCGYHHTPIQEGIRLRRHRLCKDKMFEFKNYNSVEECKEAVVKFIHDLEESGIPYEGGRDKTCKELPPGFRKLPNGYKIQKTYGGKRRVKECTRGIDDRKKFNDALTFLNRILAEHDEPQIELDYDSIQHH